MDGMVEPRRHEKYDALIYACHALAPVRTAVAHPCDETSLRGAVEAAEAKIIKPILVGPEARVRALAASFGLDLPACTLSTRRTAMPRRRRRSRLSATGKSTR